MMLYKPETNVPFFAFDELREKVFRAILSKRKTMTPVRHHNFFYIHKEKLAHNEGVKLLCEAYDLELTGAMAFWAEPFSNGLIHRDLDAWGYNIPINVAGGKQVWVDTDTPPVMTTYGDTSDKPYEVYPADTPHRTMGSLFLDRPFFVCTNVLHYTNNSENEYMRMTMSIRFKGPNPLTGS
jgi:hypothetical protein